ncbi:MAG: SGNH/GDSL hydrolase family protein [Clostridia bacterium]|nr:SGNH/GDSL hydrolase family protein [Clostridia bacterium]
MKVLFMGDSITALGVWVEHFNNIMKPELSVNIAVSSATWRDRHNTVLDGNPIFRLSDSGGPNNTLCNQVEKLLRAKDQTHPLYQKDDKFQDFDVIIVSVGTNDGGEQLPLTNEQINSQFVKEDLSPLPLELVDRTTWAGAMRYAYEHLRRLYPNAKIFYCSPIQACEALRSYKSTKLKGEVIKAVCDRISDVMFVDTFNCGICGIYEIKEQNGRDLIDGLHPNSNGGKKIAEYNYRAVKLALF